MSARLATVFLLAISLALPWPALTQASVSDAAAIDADSLAAVETATDAAIGGERSGGGSDHAGCHGKASAENDPGKTMPDAAVDADKTSSGTDHNCCADSCDCGCLTTASSVALAISTSDATPARIGRVVARATAPVAVARLLRPPIHG